MAPRDFAEPLAVTRKYPANRNKGFASVDQWLLGRRDDDGAEGLWRIHDQLYDLTTFITRHPGGRDWIQLTRGTDVTEAFEVLHVSDKPEKLLNKFHVRPAKTPRNSLITFKQDGFYKTLKRKIQKNISETGPTFESKLMMDTVVILAIISGVFATWWGFHWKIVAAAFLAMVPLCGHNFLHMGDNFRMYYFNFSLMSYRDWRVSHALSHHLYPNTIMDLEIEMFEPFLEFLPKEKPFLKKAFSFVALPTVFASIFHASYLYRLSQVILSYKLSYHKEELACLAYPAVIYLLSGSGLWTTFITWHLTVLLASLMFGLVSMTSAHHHPEIFHEGDTYMADKDFGYLQVAAVRDRAEVCENFILVMLSFGDHTLHHLFPTIDHRRLPALYPLLYETCKEFGIEYQRFTVREMFFGLWKQLARSETLKSLKLFKKS